MLDCKLREITRVKHIVPWEMNMHTHKYDELTYYISGNGRTCIGDTEFNYKPHTFAINKAGTPHNEINLEVCEIIWLHFSCNIEGLSLNEGVYDDSNGKLFACLQKLRSAYFSQEKHREILIESNLAEALVIAAQASDSKSLAASIDWQQILDYIDANIHNDIDFHSLSKKYHYSYDRFRHIFRNRFGISLHAYLTNQRIDHARYLLKGSTFSLTDIAYNCGFNSSSQFANIFKKHTGFTPKEYRKLKTNMINYTSNQD